MGFKDFAAVNTIIRAMTEAVRKSETSVDLLETVATSQKTIIFTDVLHNVCDLLQEYNTS